MGLTLFENAQLFDGIHAEVRGPAHVLVEGAEIREVAYSPIRTELADRIDCAEKTLLPGLIDCHVHIYIESLNFRPPEPPVTYRAQYARNFLRHMLSRGFTTVRDVAGGDHGMAMALRDGFLQGPRFLYGGLCLTQTGGHGDMRPMHQETGFCSCGAERNVLAIHADGVDECIKATREELRKGASHIKIMGSGGVMSPNDPLDRCQYSESEIRAIVEECARHGAYVAAHCHPSAAIRRCVEYGVRSIEHGTLIDEETAAYVANRGAFVVPTLAVLFALREDGIKMGMAEESRRKLGGLCERSLGGLEIMKRAGVKMGFGTDLLGDQHTRVGTEFSLRREVLTPLDILLSATSANAELLQMKNRLGVVQEGALADLLLVDGNPLEDLELLAAPDGRYLTDIMANGKWVKRGGSAVRDRC